MAVFMGGAMVTFVAMAAPGVDVGYIYKARREMQTATDAAALARIVREAQPDCVLVAGRYTLLDQSALDELLPLCLRHGVAVVAGGVFNSGVLANPSPGARFDYARAEAPVAAGRAF